jgi:hypothetical protein
MVKRIKLYAFSGTTTNMPSKEEILIERTYKNLPVAERILYTLTEDEVIKVNQTAKTVGLLVETLVNKGVLSEGDVDHMLLQLLS